MKSGENGLPAAWFYAVSLVWIGPRRSQFAEICSVVNLLSIRGVGNSEHVAQTSFQADVK